MAVVLAACTPTAAPPPGHPGALRYTPPSAAPWTPRGDLVVQVVASDDGRVIEGADVYLSLRTAALVRRPAPGAS